MINTHILIFIYNQYIYTKYPITLNREDLTYNRTAKSAI